MQNFVTNKAKPISDSKYPIQNGRRGLRATINSKPTDWKYLLLAVPHCLAYALIAGLRMNVT